MDFNPANQQLLRWYGKGYHFLNDTMRLDMTQTQVQNKQHIYPVVMSFWLIRIKFLEADTIGIAGQSYCLCFTADLKVIYVHDLLKIVGNSVSNVQISFISSDLLRSSLFTCFGSFRYLTLACTHLWWGFIIRNSVIRCSLISIGVFYIILSKCTCIIYWNWYKQPNRLVYLYTAQGFIV